MRRRAALTLAACITAGTTLLATPAHASGSDRVKCTSMSNGQLCISLNTSPSRIEVFYTKKDGATIKAHLGFRSTATNWGGLKTISKGERANSTWNMSYPCAGRKYVGLIKVEGQQTFETPAATC
ncbi:hypothetical protein [Streptomyces sp. I05A-00742]|uniref:hypothetical protein n=1 Tax=Streptomyces sp. I05A-00742 TaxID=2732853 RepID=UPI0014880781|nr:hypothetical protein [Streptomyces sp. I05A-00742]